MTEALRNSRRPSARATEEECITTNFYITTSQRRWLNDQVARAGTSLSEVLRGILDRAMTEPASAVRPDGARTVIPA